MKRPTELSNPISRWVSFLLNNGWRPNISKRNLTMKYTQKAQEDISSLPDIEQELIKVISKEHKSRSRNQKTTRAFYSLIQYCPDRFRDERINVGLVIASDLNEICVQTIEDFSRVLRLFQDTNIENLKICLTSCKNIIQSLANVDHLHEFIKTRANDIQLTPPRLLKIRKLGSDFDILYKNLVE